MSWFWWCFTFTADQTVGEVGCCCFCPGDSWLLSASILDLKRLKSAVSPVLSSANTTNRILVFIAKTLQKAFILKKHHHQSNKLKGSVEDVWSNIYCTCSCASLIPLNYLTVHVFYTSQIVCIIKNVKRILIEPSSSKSTALLSLRLWDEL